MTLLESFTPSLASSSRLELRRTVIRGWSAALAYNVTEPKATVTLYLSVDNRIQFVILDITQVHRVAVRSGGPGCGPDLGDVTGRHRHKRQSPCGDDIHHARQRHLLLTIATEYIHKACLLGYIVLRMGVARTAYIRRASPVFCLLLLFMQPLVFYSEYQPRLRFLCFLRFRISVSAMLV